MYPSEDAVAFAMRLYNIYSIAKNNGAKLEEATLCAKLISCLTERNKLLVSFVVSDKEAIDHYSVMMTKIKAFQDMFGKSYQRKQNARSIPGKSSAMLTSVKKSGRGNNSNRPGPNRKPKFKKPIDMSKIQCYECKEFGHFKTKCPKLGKNQQSKEGNTVTTEVGKEAKQSSPKEKDARVMATIATTFLLSEKRSDEWLID